MVALCAVLNIAGVKVVAETSLGLFILLSAPFALMTVIALFHRGALTGVAAAPHATDVGFIGAMLVCMWNYMGWDNASTVAREVDQPQRTYPRAMLTAVAVVAVSYVVPVAALKLAGASPALFDTGSWAELAGMVAGPWLRMYLVVGAMLSAFGMFNALVMSYSRLPLAMSQDGMLPRVFGRLHSRTGAPWVSIVVLAIAWALCLGIGFERLVTLDILVYGASLMLEFAALVVLRVREPQMLRPFRVPGGTSGAIAIGVLPAALLVFAVVRSENERIAGMSSFAFGMMLIAGGFAAYALRAAATRSAKKASATAASVEL
jgi:amino acid transporter